MLGKITRNTRVRQTHPERGSLLSPHRGPPEPTRPLLAGLARSHSIFLGVLRADLLGEVTGPPDRRGGLRSEMVFTPVFTPREIKARLFPSINPAQGALVYGP